MSTKNSIATIRHGGKTGILVIVFLFCLLGTYFGYINLNGDKQLLSLWDYNRKELSWDVQQLFTADPYWTTFDWPIENIKNEHVIANFADGAAVYRADWYEDDMTSASAVTYYCDRYNHCIMAFYDRENSVLEKAASEIWHYIDSNGVVRFAWMKLLKNLTFLVFLYGLPIIGLVITLYCFVSSWNSRSRKTHVQ